MSGEGGAKAADDPDVRNAVNCHLASASPRAAPLPFVNGEDPRQPDKNNNATRDTPALRMSPPRSPTTRETLYDGFGGLGGALGGSGVAPDDTAFVKGATARLLAPPWWSYGRQ